MANIISILDLLTKLLGVVDPIAKILQKVLGRGDKGYEMRIIRFNEYLYRHFGSYFYTVCTMEERYLDIKNRNSRIGLSGVFDTLSRESGSRVVLIWAEGGMGKTALAAHIIRTVYLRNKWFNVLLGGSAKQQSFVNGELRTYDDAILTYSSLLNLMGTQFGAANIHRVDSVDEKMEFLQRKLRSQRALVIVDNIETLANTQEIVDGIVELVASTKGSRALITTRDGRVTNRNLLSVHLPPMSTEEGLEFARWYVNMRRLHKHSAIEFTEDLLKGVVENAGGSPLAIEQMLSQTSFIGEDAIHQMKEVSSGWKRFYDFLFSNILYSSGVSLKARRLLWYVVTLHRPSTYDDLKEFAKQEDFTSGLNDAIKTLIQLDLLKVGRLFPDVATPTETASRKRSDMALYSVSPLLANYVLRHSEHFRL